MNLNKILRVGTSACLLLTAHKTLAHDAVFHGANHNLGIISGLAHSFTGIDHLLAMVAVGALASQKNSQGPLQRNFWLLPLLFIICMAAGAMTPQQGVNFSAEPLVAGSLIVLGAMVMLAKALPLLLTSSVVVFFAFCHGLAHGATAQAAAPGFFGSQLFILGAVMASAILHTSGFLAAHLVSNILLRLAGLGVLFTGAVLSL